MQNSLEGHFCLKLEMAGITKLWIMVVYTSHVKDKILKAPYGTFSIRCFSFLKHSYGYDNEHYFLSNGLVHYHIIGAIDFMLCKPMET